MNWNIQNLSTVQFHCFQVNKHTRKKAWQETRWCQGGYYLSSQPLSRCGSVNIFAPESNDPPLRVLFQWNWIINAVQTWNIRVLLNDFLASGRVQDLLRPASGGCAKLELWRASSMVFWVVSYMILTLPNRTLAILCLCQSCNTACFCFSYTTSVVLNCTVFQSTE